MSTKQTPSDTAPITQTQTNPPAPLVDTLVELLFTPNSTPFSVAAHLHLSLLALARLVATPDVQAAIALVESLFRRHASIDALDSLRRSLHTLDALTTLPESPSPADRDRARRAAETTRRSADLIRKFILPPPTPRKSKPDATTPEAPSPSILHPATPATLHFATPSLDHSATSSSSPANPATLHSATPSLDHSTTSSPATPSLPTPTTESTLHFATSSLDHSTTSSSPSEINLDHIDPNSPEYRDVLLSLQAAHPDLRTQRPDLFTRPTTSVA